LNIFNKLSGKVRARKHQKILEKKEKYYRSEILPEIRKIVQGEFVTSKIGLANKLDENKCDLSKEELLEICKKLVTVSTRFRKISNSFDCSLRKYLQDNKEMQQAYNIYMKNNKSSNNFEYNNNLYFLDVFKLQCEQYKESDLAKCVADKFLNFNKSELIEEINGLLNSISRSENVIIPSMLMTPQLVMSFNYIMSL